jgi:hypothetical protein
MASKETWETLRYFKPNGLDNFGDPDAINDALLFRLDDFRHFLNVPFYVTSGVRPETDGRTSYHTRSKGACAVDVVMPEHNGHPIDLIFAAMRFGFSGIGYYPDWEFKGIQCGGLHLDTRPLGIDADGTLNYGHSLWMGVKAKDPNDSSKIIQKYIPLTYANIVRTIRRS